MPLKPDTDKMEAFREARADLKADLELLAIFDSGQFRGRLASEIAREEAADAAKKAVDKSILRYTEAAKAAGF